MTDSEAKDFVESSIQFVRIGSFTAVFQNKVSLKKLRELTRRSDTLGVQSQAILAETYDQVGMYKDAGEIATLEIGKRELDALRREIGRGTPARDAVRAHAWLLLQCAVSQFRREGGQKHGLGLLDDGIELIRTKKGEAVDSQHIQSLFHFWRGRINTAQYAFSAFRDADEDFKTALRVADQTLKEKLRQAEEIKDKNKREEKLHRQVTAGNYVLSTCLGFGLGQARQLEGKLLDSMWFLRVAVPLSRGSGDFHRRGYAHMLMGTALRGTALQSENDLDAADEELNEAKRLFGEPESEDIPPHRLHLARVHHQLALSSYNRVPPGGGRSIEEKEYLAKAKAENDEAERLGKGKDYEGYRDPVLEYGIKVARSLIETALGEYGEAHTHALEAIGSSRELPGGTHGWALVATGMALAERVVSLHQTGEIRAAEAAFEEVIEDRVVRPTDRAAAHLHLSRLYSRISQPFKAAVHCDRAEPYVKNSEHGWLKDLQASAKVELTTTIGPEMSIDLRDLLKSGKEKKADAWQYIAKSIDVDVKRRLLQLNKDTLEQEDGEEKVAVELGVSRATIFNWKRDPDLKDLFPSPKARRHKRAGQ